VYRVRSKTYIAGILLIAMLLVLGACAPTPEPTPAPAKFEVISLDIKPVEAVAGETVSITAMVENTGGSEGTYAVMLTVDGVTVETKEVAITPGSSKVVTFSLVKDKVGTYTVAVGDLSSSLTVRPKLVAPEPTGEEPMRIQIQFLGHAGFRIWDNSTVLMVDPWLSRYPREIDKVTLILLTHEHGDHMDIPALKTTVAKTGARIAGPDIVLNMLKTAGIANEKLVKLNRGQDLTEGLFRVTAIPSGTIQGYLIQTPSGTIYLSGDEFTWEPAVREVATRVKSVDIALLAVADLQAYPGGYSTFRTFVSSIKPQLVVPMHELREVSFKPADHEVYAKDVLAYGGVYKIPELGEIFELPIAVEK